MASHIRSIQRWYYSELRYFPAGRPTRSEWKEINDTVSRKTAIWRYWFFFVLLALLVTWLLLAPDGRWRDFGLPILLVLTLLPVQMLHRANVRPELRKLLTTLGTHFCPRCGYDRTSTSDKPCPECGGSVEPS